MPMPNNMPAWIAWETQRRSLTLSGHLGFGLSVFDHGGPSFLRYPWSALRTLALLARRRPSLVVVQNPSMALAALACACKRVMGYALAVDRHSNFLLGGRRTDGWKARLFMAMSGYTIRNADVTIVTNQEIAAKVVAASGRPFILPDPYPDLEVAPLPARRAIPEIVFVCSWAPDEPIPEMMEACAAMRGEMILHVTGRPKPEHAGLLKRAPDNFRPTGFLSDPDYFRLLEGADALAVLTTQPSTLLCGAYEGIALGKPLLLSGSKVLRDYFTAGAVFLDSHDPDEIAVKTRRLLSRRLEVREEGLAFLERSRAAWRERFADLRRILEIVSSTVEDDAMETVPEPAVAGRLASPGG